MNKKIKLLISNQLEWIGRELIVLVLANILAAIMVKFVPVHEFIKWIFIACLGYRNYKFSTESTIMPSTTPTLNTFTWKYLQGLSFDRRDLLIGLSLTQLITMIPFFTWCLVFAPLFNSIFSSAPLKTLELLRLFISFIIFIFSFGFISIGYVIYFPRQQFQRADFNESFLASIKIGLYIALVMMYTFLILKICANHDISIQKALSFIGDGIEFIFETWMLPIALILFGIYVFKSTIRTWVDEKTSYRKKALYNSHRDKPRMIIASILIAIPYYTFDFNLPYAYSGHDILKAIYQKDQKLLEQNLSDRTALQFQNRFGFTPLMVAAAEGNLDYYKKLEDAGAIYNDEEVKKGDRSRHGMNLLYLAIDSQSIKMVEYILSKNFDPNIKLSNREASPMHFAAGKCDSPLLDLLIKFGGDINLKRAKDLTPLHKAVTSKCFGEVVLLVENGADLSVKDSEGKTPGDYAEGEIAYYLKKKYRK